MKSFVFACAILTAILLLILWSSAYCSETVALTFSAIDALESAEFQTEKAADIYAEFQKRGKILKYFTVTSYIEEVQIPLSALRYVSADDTEMQQTLIEEARLKLEKLRVAGKFTLETIL
jgi:hypothetical protein